MQDAKIPQEPTILADEQLIQMDELVARYREVIAKIPVGVELCLVSKFHPVWQIETVYSRCGHRYFGENYVQHLISRSNSCSPDILWAMIGQLQSNKVNSLIKNVHNLHVVETLDSVVLATKLNDAVVNNWPLDKCLNVMIQVNITGEASKSGVPHDDESSIYELAHYVATECSRLKLVGWMGIASAGDENRARREFALLRDIGLRIFANLGFPQPPSFSMGMTDDMAAALAEGSTEVRIGTAVFGTRS